MFLVPPGIFIGYFKLFILIVITNVFRLLLSGVFYYPMFYDGFFFLFFLLSCLQFNRVF